MSGKIFATAVAAGIALLTAIAGESENNRKAIEKSNFDLKALRAFKAENNAEEERKMIDRMREEEDIRRKEHQKKMLDLERKRRELEDAAKKANVKDEQHRKDVQSLIQVLSDYKETNEKKDAENRKITEEFMAEKEKNEREKNKLIEEKDKALKEKDKYFEEYKQAIAEKAEQERRRYEDIRFFEKTLRKMQSMMTKHMIKNHDDKNVLNLCLEVNDIVDSYEGPDDMQRIEDSMRNLGRTLASHDQE